MWSKLMIHLYSEEWPQLWPKVTQEKKNYIGKDGKNRAKTFTVTLYCSADLGKKTKYL